MPANGEGTKVYGTVTCPNCGEVNLFNAQYCTNCGHTLTGPPRRSKRTKPKRTKKPKALGKGLQIESLKEGISTAFSLALAIGWSLFSIVLAVWVYSFLAFFGPVAFVLATILLLHLFAPVVVWSELIKKKNYGTIVFVCWLILSLLNAMSVFTLASGLGTLGALAVTIFAWVVLVLVYAFVNWMLFDFPF